MSDDERRAEIEAVALNEFAAWLREWRDGIDVYDPATQGIYDALDAVLARFGAALDRLRDARGDDEGAVKALAAHLVRRYGATQSEETNEQAADLVRVVLAARSPQGEDREAGIEAMARVIHPRFDEYAAHGQARWLDEARDALAAYIARVSPSRDGTVAVEDVVAWAYEYALSNATRDTERMYEALRARFALAEFARPATGEQTDHGGNQ